MKTNPKSLLKYFLYLNAGFLLLYALFLKTYLIEKIKLTEETADYNFYFEIFSNLEIAIIVFLVFLGAILLLWNKIKNLIESIKDIKKFFIFLLIAVTFFKILFLVFVQTIPFSDAEHYVTLAKRLYETGSYLNNSGNYTVYFPVGYPFIISVFYNISSDAVLLTKIFNILIFNATLIVLYSIFKTRLNKNQLIIFLVTFAFLPNNFFSSNVLMTDYLFLLFVWLIFYIFLKDKILIHFILIGLLLGFASYIRPLAMVLPLLFFFYYMKFERKSAVLKFAIMTMFMFLVILPWAVRNYYVFDSIVLVSANAGVNFLIGNHENSNGGYNYDVKTFPSDKNEVVESKLTFQKGLDDIWNNPVKSVLRIPVKIFKAYCRFDSAFIWSFKRTGNEIPVIVLSILFYFSNALFFLIILFNVLYLIKNKIKFESRLGFLAMLFYVYTLLLIIIFFGSDRFIIPLIPIHIYLFAKYFYKPRNKHELA